MTRQKQLILGASFTLLTLALVVIKLIKMYTHDFFSDWEIVDPFQFILACPMFATFVVAVFGIITFWLPPKPQFVFGIVVLYISGVFLLLEFSAGVLLVGVMLFGAKPEYAGIDPFFSMLIIAQTAVAMALGRKKRQ